MKLSILIVALALTSAANANPVEQKPVPVDSLPAAMTTRFNVDQPRSENNKFDLWCKDYNGKSIYSRRAECHNFDLDIPWMSVSSFRLAGHEWECGITKIWRLVKGRSYRLELRCAGLAEFWDERAVISLSADGKILFWKFEWRSKYRDEKSEDITYQPSLPIDEIKTIERLRRADEDQKKTQDRFPSIGERR
jgi:hypothetical protein